MSDTEDDDIDAVIEDAERAAKRLRTFENVPLTEVGSSFSSPQRVADESSTRGG